MLSPNELTKDDLRRAFDYLRMQGTEASKIIANPVFEDVLFGAGVGVPVELNETEIGVKFVGQDGENVNIRVCSDDLLANFKETVCGRNDEVADGKMLRLWRWDDAPLCLKELSEHGGDEEWIILVPPALFRANLPWIGQTIFGHSADMYLLPCGWQVFISAH